MANLLAGEVGIHTSDGHEYVFRPSFRALADIGDIEKTWSDIQTGGYWAQSGAVSDVFRSCMVNYDDDAICRMFGYLNESGEVIPGECPHEEQVIIATSLLRNGITGGQESSGKSSGSSDKFNPAEYVGAIVASFSQEVESAWNMTMHEFLAVMHAKYPDVKNEITPQKVSDFLDMMDGMECCND